MIGWQRYEVLSGVSLQFSANLEPLQYNASGASSSWGFQAIAGFQKLRLLLLLKVFTEVEILPERQLVLVKSHRLQKQFRKAVAHFELEEKSCAKRSSSTCLHLIVAWSKNDVAFYS